MITFAFIFARGGSKGIPQKNIKRLLGKPLIAYTIDLSKNIKNINKIFVSTDDKKISKVAINYGAEVIPRPAELAQDSSPEWLAWQHAIDWVEKKYGLFDIFLSLPATSPLRNKFDIKKSLSSFNNNKSDVVIGITKANRSPWFNMVKQDKNKNLQLIIKGDKKVHNRQEAPSVFDMTTVAYVTTPKFVKNSKGIFDGDVKGIEIPPERAVDIDTKFDFEIAEYLMCKNK